MEPQLQLSASPAANGPGRAHQSWCRTAWRITRLVLICYLSVMVLMMIFEEHFIFIPTPYDQRDYQPPGLVFEDAWFEADDGTKIHGWYVPHDDPRAVVLFCHGNAGNLSHRADTLRVLHDRVGVSVLIFDYRGYGRSEGKPDEAGVLADARAARAWLAKREAVDKTEIVLMGRSLGGAVAVELAARDGARALVLESTFSSAPDVAGHYYPWLPVRFLMRTRLNSIDKIADYHGPLLQSHSRADTIIPYRFGRRLFEAANQPKKFIPFPGVGHNDPQPLTYYSDLTKFLNNLKQQPARMNQEQQATNDKE